MTDDERAIYDRMPWRMQQAVDAASPPLQSMAIAAWANANPEPFRKRVKPNPPTTPDRTTVDPRPKDGDFTDPSEERYP